eukprot:TRINITY_DN6022_c0_g1_i4.p1 TRINITY_DN6022_c0_g1~~TRINITY_DN6022_c0_g1_i4.p1  ORF type:complete len:281 (+),score=23.46 TRINITY_DN6022_c0_g1_i4:141-983(+)
MNFTDKMDISPSQPLHSYQFSVTWRIPDFETTNRNATLCSHICRHSSGLEFQLVGAPLPTTGTYALYVVLSNANAMKPRELASVQFGFKMKNLRDDSRSIMSSGSVALSQTSDNSFRSEGCHNFCSDVELEKLLPELLDNPSRELIVRCDLSIKTNFDRLSNGNEPENPLDVPKDGAIAICAPNSGFWLARLQRSLNLADRTGNAGKHIEVQWFDEVPSQAGTYVLTSYKDQVEFETIHPVRSASKASSVLLTCFCNKALQLAQEHRHDGNYEIWKSWQI